MMTHADILAWLAQDDPDELGRLWRLADDTRHANVGDAVHLRGLVEVSNYCRRQCAYCGLRAGNRRLGRYRMTGQEVLDCARQAARLGYGTVVMQAGEDRAITRKWMTDVIRTIRADAEAGALAITLSLGERGRDELAAWKAAGADRYLLRFETSNRALFDRIHPPRPGVASDRIAILRMLRELGYEVGSGVMIGIPGQTYDDLARDILLFAELELDMIGVGPFIAHPGTPLGEQGSLFPAAPEGRQVPATEEMTYKVVALARLACPRANIPATTALATLNLAEGRELGLQRGANVVMPNLTPPQYRPLYEIYPGKACVRETADLCQACVTGRIESIGRTVGKGRGDSMARPRRADVL
jgi:biotin synthase